ncbi:hypothetical protein GCM10011608_01020 [Micromonospora sonchi]|uniref:Uncharacterized protein n=1 Tax=Micromonospora sonchi TaxID=1763543 RepID=A0A917TEW4_9ACTN|nr:hypothetical protein GCM10011608_01020 [Micromonospora sonchi]
MLRLNTAIPPARRPNRLGVLGGDLAAFPNGRRVTDDVVTIALRTIAGLTEADVTAPFLRNFPFLGTPYDGFKTPVL